tara:strand:- start:2082 stop:3368 length:1287 start_codon:yes stop_codon:yes gene_type:complete
MATIERGFIVDNQNDAFNAFAKKIRYRTYTRSDAAHVIDFNLGEMVYYGRMDNFNIPVSLGASPQKMLAPTRRTKSVVEPEYGLNFVMMVFEEMALHFEKAVATRQILPSEKYLSNLTVYRGFDDPWIRYRSYTGTYLRSLYGSMLNLGLNPTNTFKNMKELLNFFPAFTQEMALTTPFTYPSYIKSRMGDILGSGLALELADLSYSNDEEKINHFYNSRTWNYYVNACNEFGFRIDANIPWRIVADIDSSIMKFAANRLQMPGGRFIFSSLYEKGAQTYLRNMPKLLLEMYNLLSPTAYEERTSCPAGGEVRKIKRMRTYQNYDQVLAEIDIKDILTFYMRLRLNEQMPEMDTFQRDTIMSDCLKLYQSSGQLTLPLTIFESIVSSTIDKIGSFSYHKKHIQAFYKQMYDRGEIDALQVEAQIGGGY